MSILKRVKRSFWRLVHPVWPHMRDFLLWTRIIWHEQGRQRFHIGWLKSDKHHLDFKKHLESVSFHHHGLSWVDEDEIFSMRKTDGDFQYHVRLFKDHEVRGHYEYSVEAHWYNHFFEIGMEDRGTHFWEILRDWIVRDDAKPRKKSAQGFLERNLKRATHEIKTHRKLVSKYPRPRY